MNQYTERVPNYRNYIELAGYPASLEFPTIHTLCIIKLCEELVAEVSLAIVTASSELLWNYINRTR